MMYALSREELAKLRSIDRLGEFVGAEMLSVTFRTDADVVERILPHPLKPTLEPVATAFVARYPETNFGCVYNEGALFVGASYHGEKGLYCLAMPVDDDMALIYGREIYGFPKKIAEEITLDRKGDRVVGRVVRKGEEMLRIEARLEGAAPSSEMGGFAPGRKDLEGRPCNAVTSFLYKFFQSPEGGKLDYAPRLVRQVTLFRPRPGLERVSAEVRLGCARTDPCSEIPVLEVLDGTYGTWDNTMLRGKVVHRALNPLRVVPHLFFKTDMVAHLLGESPPPMDRLSRLKRKWRLRKY